MDIIEINDQHNNMSSIMQDDSYEHEIDLEKTTTDSISDIYLKISSIENQLKNITTTYLTLITELTSSNNKLISSSTNNTFPSFLPPPSSQQQQPKKIYFHIISYYKNNDEQNEDNTCHFFIVSGRTYDVRDMLKQKGGQWDKDTKGWKFEYTIELYDEIYTELKTLTDDIKLKEEYIH